MTTEIASDEMAGDGGAERRLTDLATLLHQGFSADEAALRVLLDEHAGELAPPTATLGDPDALWRAAVGFDVDGLTRALDKGFALGTYAEVVDGWLLPSLHHMGLAWERGELGVAEEHFASASVHRRLATIFDQAPRQLHAPRVLVGLAPGSRHELGVLAFAVALREEGVDAVYLGGDVPLQSWVDSITRHTPAGVVIAVPTKEDVVACRRLVTALTQAAPGVPLVAGGSYQDLLDPHVTRLGHSVIPAAARLAGAVRAKV
ncbi:cobalamin B12-binding domain-containing protein [Nocardioides solisilvae]|uniref:cobalamin B12-binding domain-containing protein n=1 Tax=Nocardioides solisilvae TaxID=1542435 RepID=UPI0013A575B2|nr:cobalamin B12-binding domain-containing protein [Nocardioides solisilvae]